MRTPWLLIVEKRVTATVIYILEQLWGLHQLAY